MQDILRGSCPVCAPRRRRMSATWRVLPFLVFCLLFGRQTCAFTVTTIGANTGAFGIGFLYTKEPVIQIETSERWEFEAALPEESTAFAYFAALPTQDIYAPLSIARFRGCELLNAAEVNGTIVLVDNDGNTPCPDYYRATAAQMILDRAGALGVVSNHSRWRNSRDLSAYGVPVKIPCIYMKPDVFGNLTDLVLDSAESGNSTMALIRSGIPQEIRDARELSRNTENLVFIGMPIMHVFTLVASVAAYIFRTRQERIKNTKIAGKLLRLCLAMCVLHELERFFEWGVDPRGRYGVIPSFVHGIAVAYGICFTFTILFLVTAWWAVVISWAGRIFTPQRIFRAVIVVLLIVYPLVLIMTLMSIRYSTSDAVFVVVALLIIFLLFAFGISGGIFLYRLRQSNRASNVRSGSKDADEKLRILEIRMTLMLMLIWTIVLAFLCFSIYEIIEPGPVIGHMLLPLIYDILRWLIVIAIVATLWVTPSRKTRRNPDSKGSTTASIASSASSGSNRS